MESAPRDPGREALRKLGAASAEGRATEQSPASHATTRLMALWSVQLKAVSDEAARQLNVEVLSAKLVRVYDATDRDAALFELESSRGLVHAILSRSGQYTFFWKR